MAALTRPARPAPTNDNAAGPFVVRLPAGLSRLELSVPDVHCASCIRAVEGTLGRLDGVEAARVNLGTRKVSVTWRGSAQNERSIVAALDLAGFSAIPFDAQADDTAEADYDRFLVRCLAVAGFAAGNVMLFSVAVWSGFGGDMGLGTRTLFYVLSALIAVPATLYAGRPFYRSAWRALARGRANMDVPISIAVLLALVMSLYQTAIGAPYAYFDASVTLLFFLLIGRYLDHLLRYRTRGAARALLTLQSATAHRLDGDGRVGLVAVRDIVVGDRLLVMPGERVPVDGIVETGRSDVDTSLVSGESLPQAVEPASHVGAGTLNLSARLTVLARARVEDSLVAELARIVEAGEQSRSRYVRLADRAARLYVPVVHTIAFAVFVFWWAFSADGFMAAMHNAVATLIITCPCALGLAVPTTQVVAVGRLLRAGILVKSGDALERLAEIDTVLLDKTGTLTFGRPVLVNAGEVGAEIIADAARLARASKHPLSRALAEAAGPGEVMTGAREIAGLGIEGGPADSIWRLGRRDWAAPCAPASSGDGLEIWFARGGEAPVRLVFDDAPRPDAQAFIAGLQSRGLSVEIISGDRPDVTSRLAAALGVETWQGGTLPGSKVARIKELAARGRKALMIGDGLNDAAALAAAHVSAAPSGAADASQVAADFIFTGARLAPILLAIDVARQSRVRVLQGFGFAALYNVFAIPFGAAGLVTPVVSAIAMSASSLAVTLNALRPIRERRR